jgi:hypothetical protein
MTEESSSVVRGGLRKSERTLSAMRPVMRATGRHPAHPADRQTQIISRRDRPGACATRIDKRPDLATG